MSVGMVKTAFREWKTMLTGKLNLNLKKKPIKTPVWSVASCFANMDNEQSRYKENELCGNMEIWKVMETDTLNKVE